MLAGAFSPAFPVELVEKDLKYLADAVPPDAMPLSTAARSAFERVARAGHGGENITAVARLYGVGPHACPRPLPSSG